MFLHNLIGGNVAFNVLGITFSVNLDAMVELNYNKAIDKFTKDVLKWQNRNLTQIGRVTVIKSFLLPKFVHLFTSLPTPKSKIKEIIFSLYFYGITRPLPQRLSPALESVIMET